MRAQRVMRGVGLLLCRRFNSSDTPKMIRTSSVCSDWLLECLLVNNLESLKVWFGGVSGKEKQREGVTDIDEKAPL